MNGKEIEEEINRNGNNASKDVFTLAETKEMITEKWFAGKGREAEAEEMFQLFDRKEKGLVGLNEIKNIFNQYLDIVISDADIMEFIDEADTDKDGYLSKEEFFTKLGYI